MRLLSQVEKQNHDGSTFDRLHERACNTIHSYPVFGRKTDGCVSPLLPRFVSITTHRRGSCCDVESENPRESGYQSFCSTSTSVKVSMISPS